MRLLIDPAVTAPHDAVEENRRDYGFMFTASVFLSAVLALLLPSAQAAPPVGLSFSHNDWEMACDNTRTCRAAGYQGDDDELAVSVLLTRKAGPRQPVSGEVAHQVHLRRHHDHVAPGQDDDTSSPPQHAGCGA